ncbi:MAG TPA: hypothetical protein VIG25_03550 [Pyrinomonadaceae bacterium]
MLIRFFVGLIVIVSLAGPANTEASQGTNPQKQTKAKTTRPKNEEADDDAMQRRTVAISLVNSLADEARSFKDQTRRARVQARAADVLWETDNERSRDLFRRAWEAAEAADAETARLRAEEERKQVQSGGAIVLRGGPDLRIEVLRLAAKRDSKLGEQFLKMLDEADQKARQELDEARRNTSANTVGTSKRLQLARRLAEDGEVERALEFAGPALDKVNVDSIFFLSTLREKKAQLADAAFATLMARVARDPLSDANTVSGLSSYLFTPFLYITFEADGGSNQNRGGRSATSPVDAPDGLRKSFLQVGFQILMQPLPAPDQDHTTSG